MQRGGAGVVWLTLNASFASVFLFAIIAALPERFSSPVATVSTSESLMGLCCWWKLAFELLESVDT